MRTVRKRSGPARIWPITIAVTALVWAAPGCSGSSTSAHDDDSPSAEGSASSPSAVAYSSCMRSHGVPDFPDPGSDGRVPKADPQALRVSSPQLRAAQSGCRHLYPASGGAVGALLRQCEETGICPQAMVTQVVTDMRNFSRCMRSRGVPNWPDPTIDSEGRPGFNLVPIHGTDWNAADVQNAIYECEHLMPPGGGVPAIYPGGPG